MKNFKIIRHVSRFFFLPCWLVISVGTNSAISQTAQQIEDSCKRLISQKFVGSTDTTSQYGVRTITTSEIIGLVKQVAFSPEQQPMVAAAYGPFGANWVYMFNLQLKKNDSSKKGQSFYSQYRVFCIANPDRTQILGIESQLL